MKIACETCQFPFITSNGRTQCIDCVRGKKLNWAKSLSAAEKEDLVAKLTVHRPSATSAPLPAESEGVHPPVPTKHERRAITLNVTGCLDHPKYGGVRSPRTDCRGCWSYYTSLHPDRKKP